MVTFLSWTLFFFSLHGRLRRGFIFRSYLSIYIDDKRLNDLCHDNQSINSYELNVMNRMNVLLLME